jgi:hypothetical protein
MSEKQQPRPVGIAYRRLAHDDDTRSERLSIRVSPALHWAIVDEANLCLLPVSAWVERLIRRELEHPDRSRARTPRKRRAS